MTEPQANNEKIAAQISEMAAIVFGVPQDELGLETADDCAEMLRILSGTPVESTDEPFIPTLKNQDAGEDAE